MESSGESKQALSSFENEFPRVELPHTSSLKASIIQQASSEEQRVGFAEARTRRSPAMAHFKWWFSGAAVCASLALFMLVQPFSNTAVESTIVDSYTASDIEWQEIMLTEDELLFAQL